MEKIKKLFIDSSGFIALADQSEKTHEAVVQFVNSLSPATQLFTSNFVIDETVTRIRTLLGAEIAYKIGENLLKSKKYKVIFIDSKICLAALEKLRKYSDQTLSFTDCTSAVLMESLKIREVLSLDDDFVKVGFRKYP